MKGDGRDAVDPLVLLSCCTFLLGFANGMQCVLYLLRPSQPLHLPFWRATRCAIVLLDGFNDSSPLLPFLLSSRNGFHHCFLSTFPVRGMSSTKKEPKELFKENALPNYVSARREERDDRAHHLLPSFLRFMLAATGRSVGKGSEWTGLQ